MFISVFVWILKPHKEPHVEQSAYVVLVGENIVL